MGFSSISICLFMVVGCGISHVVRPNYSLKKWVKVRTFVRARVPYTTHCNPLSLIYNYRKVGVQLHFRIMEFSILNSANVHVRLCEQIAIEWKLFFNR